MLKERLSRLGLTSAEAELYLVLLGLSPAFAGALAKKTRFHRSNVYDLLQRLIDKGMVSSVLKSGKKQFFAVEPRKVSSYLDEQQKKVDDQKEVLAQLIPDLERLRFPLSEERVEVFEDREGLKTVLEDILATKKTVRAYGTQGNFSLALRYSFKHFLHRFEEKKMRMMVVFSKTPKQKPFRWSFACVRYLPEKHASPTETMIYGDTVAIFVFTAKPRVILIRSASVASAYRSYFDVLWTAAVE